LEKKLIDSLSVIFPVFNEQSRINNSLNKIKKFILSSNLKFLEIIFIDDGSTDKTYFIIKNFISSFKNSKIRLILLKNYKNFGKGFALKKGVKYSSAKWVLTSDIDLSVNINYFNKWFKNYKTKKKYSIYFASRNHPDSKVKKVFIRYLLGKLFVFFIYFFFKIKFKDTQCGFKLYKNTIAKKIFSKLKTNKFAHDVEIVLIANLIKCPIKEMPVKWVHKKYSKVNIFLDTFLMFWDLLLIKIKFFNKI
jgi:dolichyl-phosphate beta-glucosyltransferase